MRFPIAILILLVASAGCVTTGAVLLEPATSGSVQRYAVAPDSLGAAAIRALAAGGLRTVRDTMQGDTRLIVG
ncbi:MAG TPA: hypothetical protein VFT84_05880, partial [Gemmatimonadales bacterium]|nr:hypothetical protein [Gemmatimonadales bacterium]